MGIEFNVHESGPFFDGRAEAAIHMYKNHLEDYLGRTAVSRIRAYLPTQYMYLGHNGGTPMFNPVPSDAGRLASSVYEERATEDLVRVTEDPVVYGPWIEGVAEGNAIIWPHRRNPPPRRFPGYFTFRKISQELDTEVEDIATRELQFYIEEMN
jgi:hypothetical protein